jgi:hypothetical protein
MLFINLATEDLLSEAVAEKLVATFTKFQILERLGKKGNGHLKKNLKCYIEIARHTPLLLLTDLDQANCAPGLVSDWLGNSNIAPSNNFLFRVAVREVESWLLADHTNCSKLFDAKKLPPNPDHLPHPKKTLLSHANRSNRSVRSDLVYKVGSVLTQGLGYNAKLRQFVFENWNPHFAMKNSPSLSKTCNRLCEFDSRF